jgi:hypothetical protein
MISQVAAFVVPSKLADSGQIQAQPYSSQYRASSTHHLALEAVINLSRPLVCFCYRRQPHDRDRPSLTTSLVVQREYVTETVSGELVQSIPVGSDSLLRQERAAPGSDVQLTFGLSP